MERLWQDARYGFRMTLKNPGFTVVAVLTLAIGIGANTAIFSVVNGILLKPLPYKEPDRLVRVFEQYPQYPKFPMSPANFLDYRERNNVFDGLAVYTRQDLELSLGDKPELLPCLLISSGYFELLGYQPELGRPFLREEELPGKEKVAMLSHALWQRSFASDPEIVGKTITLSGNPYVVVGVMPAGFQHVGGTYRSLSHGETVAVWVPFILNPQQAQRGSHYLNVVARLKPGISQQQAETEMNLIAAGLEQQYPDSNKDWRIMVKGLREEIVGGARPALFVLLGAVCFVLLIACTNVANLMLARATAREREMAVRTALGAGRFRLVRQMLTESFLIATLGGLLGLLLAMWMIDLLLTLSSETLPRAHMIGVDSRILMFAVGLTFLTGLLFGLVPAFQGSKVNINELLKEGGRGTFGGPRQRRLRSLLVITEVSLAFVLLIGAGLLMQSFLNLERVEPGFNPQNVLTMSIPLPRARYEKGDKRVEFYQSLIDRVKALPAVRSAAITSDLPWDGYDENTSFTVEGKVSDPENGPHARYHFVSPEYFQTIGVPLVAGRFLTGSDKADAPSVILINESMANRYWPGENAVGKRITFNDNPKEEDWLTVAGVVGDVKDTPGAASAEPAFYWPHAQAPYSEMILALRTDTSPLSLVEAVRREVLALDKDLPIADVRTLDDIAAASVSRPRFTLMLVGFFALVAMLLAAIGIYGVISYSVSRRTHEIGIRMALGAKTSDVLKMVVGQAITLVSFGVGAGVAASIALTRLMGSLLFGVSATDPLMFIGISILMGCVSLLASYIPARRAAAVDPMEALRYE